MRPIRPLPLLLAALLAPGVQTSHAQAALTTERLSLSNLPSDAELVRILWEHAPSLIETKNIEEQSRAEVVRAGLLPNPEFDVSWNTIPIGARNPPDHDFWRIPNYQFGLSELVEVGKRGPRKLAAKNGREANELETRDSLRLAFYDLLDTFAEVATAERRVVTGTGIVQDAARLTEIQKQRAAKGDVSGLDVDRAQLEQSKLLSTLDESKGALEKALRRCAHVAGIVCEPFGTKEAAKAFLTRRFAPEAPVVTESAARRETFEKRPDVASLSYRKNAAKALESLANAKAIPDPTIRFGYVRDEFYISGNQLNSLFVGVSIPLPVFDRGQAEASMARSQLKAVTDLREALIQRAGSDLQRLDAETTVLSGRQSRLTDHMVPLARNVVERLEAAVARGGAPLVDLLIARQTLGELLLEQSEVDLAAFQLDVQRARTLSAGPEAPPGEPGRK